MWENVIFLHLRLGDYIEVPPRTLIVIEAIKYIAVVSDINK